MEHRKSYKIALEFLAIAAFVLLFFSCISFDIGDWPSKYVYPHNGPSENLCGKFGGFCAYYLLYYVGPGIFVVLASGIVFLTASLMNRATSEPVLRGIGLVLLTTAASASFYVFWPDGVFAFPIGSGGVLGVGTAHFLKSKFDLLGAFLLIAASWVVGLVLLADSLVTAILHGLAVVLHRTAGVSGPAFSAAMERSAAIGEIWQRLSVRQKQEEATARETLELDDDVNIEDRFDDTEKGEAEEVEKKAAKPVVPEAIKINHRALPKPKPVPPQPSYDDYKFPPLDLLEEAEYGYTEIQGKVVKSKAATLERLLNEFNINARVVAADTGPVITMFELELAAGIKVSQITSLSNDIARALSAGAVRVVAPIPGKHTIGIEVPNSEKEKVRLKDLIQLSGDKPQKMHLPLFLGKDASGTPLVSDLASMPHVLIAGTTGSGKSVCINSIIMSILLMKRPDEVKMILVDPKMVEMTNYNTVPHLMAPIVTETKRAVQILEWATVKMDERYALLAEAKVKNIAGYNALTREEIIDRFCPSNADEEAKIPKKLPYMVIIIDELADLMMMAAKEIEAYIVRLAQKSRAVGIHLVLATQRPQATVVTGLIKSNMPTRIGFRVASRMDSRIILDQNGAEALLGQGDMLFLKPGTSDLIRAQGTYLDDSEIRGVVKYLKDIAQPQFHVELTQLGRVDMSEMESDDLFDEAVRIVLETKRGSVSLLQRRLAVGYARASRMIETMAVSGILGEYKGSQAREVMLTLEEWEEMKQQNLANGGMAFSSPTAESAEYVTEGQKGYVALEEEDELEEYQEEKEFEEDEEEEA